MYQIYMPRINVGMTCLRKEINSKDYGMRQCLVLAGFCRRMSVVELDLVIDAAVFNPV